MYTHNLLQEFISKNQNFMLKIDIGLVLVVIGFNDKILTEPN